MDTFKPGDQGLYYPRRGKPGHLVPIISVRPHPFHRAWVRFRYADGREREVAIGRFHTSPE